MSKYISVVLAAIFAAVTVTPVAIAQDKKADKKMEKKADEKKVKAKKDQKKEGSGGKEKKGAGKKKAEK